MSCCCLAGAAGICCLAGAAGIRRIWPGIGETWMEPEQEQFLAKAVELAERKADGFAWVATVDAADGFERLGWRNVPQREYGLTGPLEDSGLIAERVVTNAFMKCPPDLLRGRAGHRG